MSFGHYASLKNPMDETLFLLPPAASVGRQEGVGLFLSVLVLQRGGPSLRLADSFSKGDLER